MRRDVFSPGALPATGQTASAKPSSKINEGAVCARWVRCGRHACRCMHGGPKHGPYYARYWWRDGRRYKQYVPQRDASAVAAACAVRRETERTERVNATEAREAWRVIRAVIQEIERDGI